MSEQPQLHQDIASTLQRIHAAVEPGAPDAAQAAVRVGAGVPEFRNIVSQRQAHETDFNNFMRGKMQEMLQRARDPLRAGAWRGNFAEEARTHLTRGVEIRRQILTYALNRSSLLEQVLTQGDVPNAAERREQMRQMVVDLNRKITLEEYRQMSLYNTLRNVSEVLQELTDIPADRRAAVLGQLQGGNEALARLAVQLQDLEDMLVLEDSVAKIRHTLYAADNEFLPPNTRAQALNGLRDQFRQRLATRQLRQPIAVGQNRLVAVAPGQQVLVNGLAVTPANAAAIEQQTGLTVAIAPGGVSLNVLRRVGTGEVTVNIAGLDHTLRVVQDLSQVPADGVNYDSLRALITALQVPLPADAGPRAQFIAATNVQLEEARALLQGQMYPIINGSPSYLRVPENVDQPLSLVTTPGANDRFPMPTASAVLLGLQIARHRAIATEQRSLLGIRQMGQAEADRLVELENQRRALVGRFMETSDRTLNRRLMMQSLLTRCENLGLPTELLDERHINRLKRTREYLGSNLGVREEIRRIAQTAYTDIVRDRAVTNQTKQNLAAVLNRIARLIPGGGFEYTEETSVIEPLRLLDILGFTSSALPTARQFQPAETQSLQTIRTFLLSDRGAVLRNRLYAELQQMRSLQGGPDAVAVQRAARLPGLRTVVRDIIREGGGGVVVAENAAEEDVRAVLEMLDVTDSPVFYNRMTNTNVRELISARRDNLNAIQEYMAEWRRNVNSGAVFLDGRAVLQHILTMRFLGNHSVLSMDVPREFRNLVDDRNKPAMWGLRHIHNAHDAVFPTAIVHGLTGGRMGYLASEARTEGLSIFGWQALMRMPNPYTMLEGALIPPEDIVVQDAAAIANWRRTTVTELRGMTEENRTRWLTDHFSQATMQRSVMAITRFHEAKIHPVTYRLGGTLETLEALSSSEQHWRPEDLALVTENGARPAWWQEPPAGDAVTQQQMAAWKTTVMANMVKGPDNAPNAAQKRLEAKWVYDRLLQIAEEQVDLFDERKRAYLNALSTNYSTHISNAALNMSQGDQRLNDLILAGIVVGEGVGTLAMLNLMGSRGGLRAVPYVGYPLRLPIDKIPLVGRVPVLGKLYRGAGWLYRTGAQAVNGLTTPFTLAWNQIAGRMNPALRIPTIEGPPYTLQGPANEAAALRMHNAVMTPEARATSAMQGLQQELRFVLGTRDEALLRQAINEAHAVQPTGSVVRSGGVRMPDGTQRVWSLADIRQKLEILRRAGFTQSEAAFLIRNGYCGREAGEIAQLLASNGHRVPAALQRAAATEAGVAGRTGSVMTQAEAAGARALTPLEQRLALAARGNGQLMRVGGRLLGAAAMGFQAYQVYDRLNEANRAREHAEQSTREIERQLVAAGFERQSGSNVYRHEKMGATINLDNLQNNLDGEMRARYIEAGGAAAGFVILGVAMMAGGVPGLVIGIAGIIVECTVQAVAGEFEAADRERFLRNAPAWLLTVVSAAGMLNQSQYSMLSRLTDSEWSNVLSGLRGAEKRDVRHKLLFSMMSEDLQTYAPEVLSQLYVGRSGPNDVSVIDAFYRQDFDSTLLPFFYNSLKVQLGEGATNFRWSGLVKLKDIVLPGSFTGRLVGRMTESDEETMLGRATPLQIRRALRDAVAIYLPLVNARMALEKRRELAALRAQGQQDRVVQWGDGQMQIRLSDLVRQLNLNTTYAGQDGRPRRIADMTDEELENLSVPVTQLAALSRTDLYNQTISDPITRRRMAEIYETQADQPGFNATSSGLRYGVRTLLANNLGVQLNRPFSWRPLTSNERQFNQRIVTANHPREWSQQVLSTEVANFMRGRASSGYASSAEWAQNLFPTWNVQRTGSNGQPTPAPRPLVLIPSSFSYPQGVNPNDIAAQLANISTIGDSLFNPQHLQGVVFDIATIEERKRQFQERNAIHPLGNDMIGREYDEYNFAIQATFYFTNEQGQTFVLRRSSFLYKNEDRTTGNLNNTWRRIDGSDAVFHASEFELDHSNRQQRAQLENAMRTRITNQAIERSNAANTQLAAERQGAARDVLYRRDDELASAIYRGERQRPVLHISAPNGLSFAPGSPAFNLLETLARVSPRDSYQLDQDPSAVYVEFEQRPDGSISALATYVENIFNYGADVSYNSETSRLHVRRRAAVAEQKLLAGKTERQWIISEGATQFNIDISQARTLTSRSGPLVDVLRSALTGQKDLNAAAVERALEELALSEQELSTTQYRALRQGLSILSIDGGTVLHTARRPAVPPRQPQVVRFRNQMISVVAPDSRTFDVFDLHYDGDQADRRYAISSYQDLIQRASITPSQRQEIIGLYCKPLADARLSMERIVDLFTYQVDGDRSAKSVLIAGLLPKYEQAPDKAVFLRQLFERVRAAGWLSFETATVMANELRVDSNNVLTVATDIDLVTSISDGVVSFYLSGTGAEGKRLVIEGIPAVSGGYPLAQVLTAQRERRLMISVTGPEQQVVLARQPLYVLNYGTTSSFYNASAPTDAPGEYSTNITYDNDQEINGLLREGSRSSRGYVEYREGNNLIRRYGVSSLLVTCYDNRENVQSWLRFSDASDLRARRPEGFTEQSRAAFNGLTSDQQRVRRTLAAPYSRAFDVITTPARAEWNENSAAFARPLVRIVDLFPCDLFVDLDERSRFMNKAIDMYRRTTDRRGFLRSLFEALESEVDDKGNLRAQGEGLNMQTRVFRRVEQRLREQERDRVLAEENAALTGREQVYRIVDLFSFAPNFYEAVEQPLREYSRRQNINGPMMQRLGTSGSLSREYFRTRLADIYLLVPENRRRDFLRALYDGLNGAAQEGLVQPGQYPETERGVQYYPRAIKDLLASLDTNFNLNYFRRR